MDEDLRDTGRHDRCGGKNEQRDPKRPGFEVVRNLGDVAATVAPERVPGNGDVDDEQEDRDRNRQPGERVPLGVSVPARDRGDQEEQRREPDEAEGDEARLAIELPLAAEEQGEAEDEKEVPDHAPGERPAHDLCQPFVDGEERDDELRRIAERRVQEASHARAGVVRGVLGRLSDQPGERDECRGREDEEEHLGCAEQVDHDDGGPEHQQAEEDAPRHGPLSLQLAHGSRRSALRLG